MTNNWLDNKWRHYDDNTVYGVTEPDKFIRERFSERSPYLLFYVKITRPTPVIDIATQVSVTSTNETTMEYTASSNDEIDILTEALITDEMDLNDSNNKISKYIYK